MAQYHEIEAKTVTRLRGVVDPWFLGRYGMNLYRGCEHGCLYCDGRAERYYVAGEFDRDIQVKVNAVAVLDAELSRRREPGFVFLGGGVCDAYQAAEARYRLARGALEVALRRGLPAHVLTKSALVERDLDLLQSIAGRSGAILSFSLQTVDDEVRRRFEPGAAPVSERLRLLREARRRGVAAGVMAMPVLPGISDKPEQIDALVAAAAEAGAEFVLFGGLTLRPGQQRETYLRALAGFYPQHLDGYQRLYRIPRASGAPDGRYLSRVDARFRAALARHGLPGRIPRRLFTGRVPLYAEVGVLLEHRGFACGDPSLGRAGFALQDWARRLLAENARRREFSHRDVEGQLRQRLAEIPGLSPSAAAAAASFL